MKHAIDQRKSCRKYLKAPIDPRIAEKIAALIGQCNADSGLSFKLMLDSPEAFDGIRKNYGLFSNVTHYIILAGKAEDPLAREKTGYYGELLVLNMVKWGLGTCWVAASFDKDIAAAALSEGEELYGVITMGAVAGNSVRGQLIRGAMHIAKKSAQDMYKSDALDLPDWFSEGMEAVSKAPSAMNRQPVRFYYADGGVSACVDDDGYAGLAAIDLGIAKLHFEVGAGGGEWAFGNGQSFDRVES